MKKVLYTVFAGALAGMTIAPALAADDAEKKFDFNGSLRARYENLNNYNDLTDETNSGDINDDAAGFTAYRALVGITGMFSKNVTGHVDLQYNGYFGDTGFPFFTTLFSPYNTGHDDAVVIYQGWVEAGKIGGSDFGVRVGRQEHTYGTELFFGDNDYYTGQTFDGIRGMWQHGSSDLNAFYYKLNENNNPYISGGFNGAEDSNLFGATYDYTIKNWGTAGVYAVVFQNLSSEEKVNTYGIRWNRGMMNGDKLNMLDWDVEFAKQSGDESATIDVSASVIEGWFGFNFNAGSNSHGRVHIGTLITSGDKASTPTKDEDFVDAFGDFHAHNRFGDMDWLEFINGGVHDLTDYNIGYEHWFGADHYVMLAYHMFKETETAPGAEDTIGNEIDLKYGYQYSKNLAFEVMIGQASPEEKFFGPPADTVQRAALTAKLDW